MLSLLICTTLLLAAPPDGAQPARDEALAAKVAELVKQLDSRVLAEREAAEQKLFELGPPVLPYLPMVGDRTPAEVVLRVTQVQQKLLQAQANSAAEATTVTLKGENLPLDEVLAAFSTQTGNPISDHREAFGEEKTKKTVTVEFDKTPFWRAFDQVLDQANLTLYGFAGQKGAYVINRPSGTLPRVGRADYSGVFRLEPVRFEAVQDLRNEQMQSLRFFMEVTWEPRVQPFAIMQPLSQVKVVGDGGEEIAVANATAEPEATIRDGVSAAELEIPLTLPQRSTQKIRSLKGKLQALVPGPIEEFHFKQLPVTTKNAAPPRVEQRKASVTVVVDQLRKNNDAWELSLRVRFDGPSNALESHRGWVLENDAFFLDKEGQRVEPGGLVQSRQTKNEIGIDYLFVLDDEPQKLEFVYRTPITVLEVPVAYEFRDLRLP